MIAPRHPILPSPRRDHVAVLDPAGYRLVVFGGWGGDPWAETYLNDVWSLSLAPEPAWSAVQAIGPAPPPRFAHAGIYDPARKRLIVFGGFDGTFRNDVWALSLSGAPTWSEITPAGTAPRGRDAMTAIYDSKRDRMVVFGGWDGSSYLDDIWALTLSGHPAWTRLSGGPRGPIARRHHVEVYDPDDDQMVISGGFAGNYLGDSWAFRFRETEWRQLHTPPRVQPTPRNAHRGVLDPVEHRLIEFGGYDGNYLNDTWALDLKAGRRWVELVPQGPPPLPRMLHTATYDRLRHRVVVFGGLDGDELLNDAWALELTPRPTPPGAATEPEPAAERPVAATLAVDGVHPNPTTAEFVVEFSLPDTGPASLGVFDVGGARVRNFDLGSMGPGRHTLRVGGAPRLAPGIYWIRLTRAGELRTAKAVVLR
jgi:hypothetical protein